MAYTHALMEKTKSEFKEMDITDKKTPLLNALVGCRLYSVQFVLNYVQLWFESDRLHPYVTAVTCPKVKMRGSPLAWESPGYRDALCSLIGKVVSKASVIENEEFRMEFGDETLITISLKKEDYRGPEAVIYNTGSPDNRMGVW